MAQTTTTTQAVPRTPAREDVPVLRLAWPVGVEHVAISLLAAVDGILVGRYVGVSGVAAVGIGALLFWLPFAAASGLGMATAGIAARDLSAGRLISIERSIGAALAVGLAWGALSAVLLSMLADPLLRLMAVEPEVRAFGVDYLRAVAPGLPLLMVLYVSAGAMRGLGNTTTPMAIAVFLDVTKTVATFLLISGTVGVELEVLASGIGTALAGSLGGVIALLTLMNGVGYVRLRLGEALRAGRAELRRVLSGGLPVTLEELQFMIAFLLYSRIISGLGTTALAAHTIALRILEVGLVPGLALGTAATTLVSRYLRGGRPELAKRAARQAQLWSLGTMTLMAALLALLAPQLIGLFVDDDDVIDTGSKLLRIVAIGFPFMGLHASLSGALRGAGDGRFVLGVLSATAWLVRIPVALAFAVSAGLGAPGAWIGATVENTTRGLISWGRFEQGAWVDREG